MTSPLTKLLIPAPVAEFIKTHVTSFVLGRLASYVDEVVKRKAFSSTDEDKRELEREIRNNSSQMENANIESVVQQSLRVYEATVDILKDLQQNKNGYITINVYGNVNLFQYNAEKIEFKQIIDNAVTSKVIEDVMEGFYTISDQELKENPGLDEEAVDHNTFSKSEHHEDFTSNIIAYSKKIWENQLSNIDHLRSEE